MIETTAKERPQTISIKFEEFIVKAFPQTKNTPIPKIVATIVSGLNSYCDQAEDGTFAYVRGGAMRSFALSTNEIEENLIRKVRQTDFGVDKLTKEVMEHAFGEEKDLDLFIRRGVSSNEDINNNINDSLAQIEEDPYNVEIKTQLIGGEVNPQTLFMVNFYDNKEPLRKPIFMLNFTNFPTSVNSLSKEIRNRADVDVLSLGHLNIDDSNNLMMSYSSPELVDLKKRLHHYYFDVTIGPLSDRASFLQDVIAGFREINSRALYITPLFDSQNSFITPDILISHRLYNGIHFPNNNEIAKIINANRSEIEVNLLPLLSDIIFSFIANPIIALPLAYFNKSLIMTPLGKMIDSPEKMRKVLKSMAERMGMKITDTFFMLALNYAVNYPDTLLLLDSLKDAKIIPEDWPRSYEGLLRLLNPLELL